MLLLNLKQVELINLFLLLISFCLVLILPFHIFLFAYAVLGPLHYLSQIAWLHDKNYFINREFNTKFIWIIGAVVIITGVLSSYLSSVLILFAFLLALFLVLPISLSNKLVITLAGLMAALLFFLSPSFLLVLGILLPTLIHVFIFTAMFMYVGALKSSSKLGYINTALFVSLALLFFLLHYTDIIPVTDYIKENYQASFMYLHEALFSWFDIDFSTERIFNSSFGIASMQFIAFTYTYHYLNWFSKTSVIGWGASARRYQYIIVITWILSLVVYAYDYSLGLITLAFLSLTHVLLEFPLNHRTFLVILKQLPFFNKKH